MMWNLKLLVSGRQTNDTLFVKVTRVPIKRLHIELMSTSSYYVSLD